MPDFHANIWAPWRMDYIAGLHENTPGGCFLCACREAPENDAANLVLWRSQKTVTLLNRFPYTGGHLLVAPLAHGGDPVQTPDDVLLEMQQRIRDSIRVLSAAFQAQGFNLGMNLGRIAGAGLPEHLHWHVIPRWSGDTNFMSIVGDARVIPEWLEKTRERLLTHADKLGIK